MGGWEWTGLEGVHTAALVICLLVVATFLALGVLWARKPDTRRRGIVALSVIFILTFLSALVLGLRVFAP